MSLRTPKLIFFLAVFVLACAGGAAARAFEPEMAPGKAQFISAGTQAWFSRMYLLRNARSSILASYFILSDDVFGESFLALLAEKARAGLEVKLMLDARGSFSITHWPLGRSLLREVIRAGGEVRVFSPILRRGVASNVIASDHQKFLIVDGRWLLTGGRNLSKEYFLDSNDLPGAYHDEDVLIESTALAPAARATYLEEYESARATPLAAHGALDGVEPNASRRLARSLASMEDRLAHADSELSAATIEEHPELARWEWLRELRPFVPFEGPPHGENWFTDVDEGCQTTEQLQSEVPLALLANTAAATSGRHSLTESLVELISKASREILIENPYVVLQSGTKAALAAAARRGVKITLLTNGPHSGDSKLVHTAITNAWPRLAAEIPGLAVFMATGIQQVHSKLFVFDRARTLIGSLNLDALSDHINSEDAVLVDSPAFADAVLHAIASDIEFDARELKPGQGPETFRGTDCLILRGLYFLLAGILKSVL